MLARRRTIPRAAARALLLSGVALLAAATTACSETPTHFTRLWVQGRTGIPAIGVSTEAGVLTLSEPDWKPGDRFDLQFPYGNSLVNDLGVINRMNETITIVFPATARLARGRFATSLPAPQEQLYLALRDELDEPVMQPVDLWRQGEFGDWVVVPELNAIGIERMAQQYRGTGVYVEREGRWEIVGLLAGLIATDESDPRGEMALGYIGLSELTRILPHMQDYLMPDIKPLRPDFEFGVPLQPGDLVVDPKQVDGQPATSPRR